MWLQCAAITAFSETDPELGILRRLIYPANLSKCGTTTRLFLQRHADTVKQRKKMCTFSSRQILAKQKELSDIAFSQTRQSEKPLVFLRVD